MNVLSYHVFDGQSWLDADEKSWVPNFHDSAAFRDAKRAQEVGERASEAMTSPRREIYVMACLAWAA